MSNSIRRPSLPLAALVISLSIGLLDPTAAQEPTFPAPDIVDDDELFATGPAAVDRLGADLAAVAEANDVDEDRLRRLLELDTTLAVDPNGELLYLDPLAAEGPDEVEPDSDSDSDPEPEETEAEAERSERGDGTPELASLPGATKTLLLDFDGHRTVGSSWNAATGRDTIATGPYDLDGDPATWSPDELEVIGHTWAVVAEDLAPWAVNVTTIEPADPGDLTRDGPGDARWGARVVITGDDWSGCRCGALAYLGGFADRADEPAFVHDARLPAMAETTSHAIGHLLGLRHDGRVGESARYAGHAGLGGPDWAPIMGSPHGPGIRQWSARRG